VLGSVKVPLSLLRNGSVKISLPLLGNGSVENVTAVTNTHAATEELLDTSPSLFFYLTLFLSSLTYGLTHSDYTARNQRELATCFQGGFLLGSFFDREDGGDISLRNIG
jgi:hypothetical protein